MNLIQVSAQEGYCLIRLKLIFLLSLQYIRNLKFLGCEEHFTVHANYNVFMIDSSVVVHLALNCFLGLPLSFQQQFLSIILEQVTW